MKQATTPAALQLVFDSFPLESAMTELVVSQACTPALCRAVEGALADPALGGKPGVVAGLWLYADDLAAAHEACQMSHSPTCSVWHAILHRREADFPNAAYWLHRAGTHPALKAVEGYEPFWFLDEVRARHRTNPSDLVALQRREWQALFTWALAH